MKISKLKVNGVTDPVGFDLSKIVCSWIVSESDSDYAENVQIDVSLSKDFKKLLYHKKGKHLCSAGELLQMPLIPRTTYYWRVQVKGNKGDSAVSEPAIFETGKLKEPWKAKWIGPAPQDKFHPVLSYAFDVENGQKLERARLYICGVGLYEAWLNGERIGQEYLTPYLNDYQTGLQYQTYDVKETLKERNKIEILLGNGWYKGRYGSGKENFGKQFAVIAELILEYEDGSIKTVITDTTWEYFGADIEASDIYDGEIYNHMLWDGKENSRKPAVEIKIPYSLRERYSLPVLVKEIRNVQEILHTPAGETVLDLGQNMTGYVSFQTPQGIEKGTRITLDFGEILQDGNFYRDNYRTAKSSFVYVSDGRKETVHPHFTFFGFRYVRVCGWRGALKKDDFCGRVVYSDLEQTGWIETSNPKVNRLFWNSVWGQKDNFLDIPTDCPQRDERLGWTGDICIFAPTAGYHMDTRAFLAKFLKDLRADQLRRDGITSNTFPDVLEMGGAGSVWGDAAALIPSIQYQQFGDVYELAESYPLMKDWVDSITRRDQARGETYRFDFGFHFGDWLSMDGASAQSQKGGTEDGYIGTVYYYASTCAVAEAAKVLKKKEDFKYYTLLAKHIKEAFIKEYITPAGRLAMQTQTGYLLALKYGLYTNKEKIVQGLKERFRMDGYKIKGGFVGATSMCSVLAANDLTELAYYFLLNEAYPGWLYCVDMGATTIWERWNSVLPDGKISGTGMNSLNHYAYGSVCEFLYRYAAGIIMESPGFQKIILKPQLTGKLSFVKGEYHSVYGKIVSEWGILENGRVKIHVEIPFGTTATLYLPDSKELPKKLLPGSYDYVYRPEKDYIHCYTMDTRLGELAEDARALSIFEKKLPRALELIRGGNLENLSLSMGQLSDWRYLGCGKAEIEAAMQDIMSLNTWKLTIMEGEGEWRRHNTKPITNMEGKY